LKCKVKWSVQNVRIIGTQKTVSREFSIAATASVKIVLRISSKIILKMLEFKNSSVGIAEQSKLLKIKRMLKS
jgi:hypothetical protein